MPLTLTFDLEDNRLKFVLDDGEMRDAGVPLTVRMAKYMQNSHQILNMENIITFESDGVQIEGLLHQKSERGVIVTHPHPTRASCSRTNRS